MILLGIWLSLIADPQLPKDFLGQSQIREEYYRVSSQPETLESFLRERFFLDLAEERIASSSSLTSSQIRDPQFGIRMFVKHFREAPWQIQIWLPDLLQIFSIASSHPLATLDSLSQYSGLVSVPLILALFICIFVYLREWSLPMVTLFAPRISGRNKNLASAFFLGTFIAAFLTGAWTYLLFLFFAAVSIFSRKHQVFLWITILFALSFNFLAVENLWSKKISDFTAIEALQNGRTRLEYSRSSLEVLDPIQKASWSGVNGDLESARYWLSKAEDSKEKQILEANLNSLGMKSSQTREAYESLAQRFPSDSVIQFNLYQTYTLAQNLVKADELRNQIPLDDYARYSQKTIDFGAHLIQPKFDSAFAIFLKDAPSEVPKILARVGLFPFHLRLLFLELWVLCLPWLIVTFCVLGRRRARGICSHTGKITPHPSHSASAAYLASLQQADTGNITLKRQVELEIREYSHRRRNRMLQMSWFMPGSNQIVDRFEIFSASWKLSMVFSLVWWGLDRTSQNDFLRFVHWPKLLPSETSFISWPLLLMAFVFFVVLIWLERKEANG